NEDVAARRIETLDRRELLFLVDEDQDVAVEGAPEAAAVDLARLIDGVAVGERHHPAPLPSVGDGVDRPGIEPGVERVVDEKAREPDEARIAQSLEATALDRAEIVGVARLRPLLVEDRPVPLPHGLA